MSKRTDTFHVSFRLDPKNIKYAEAIEKIMFENNAIEVHQTKTFEQSILNVVTKKDGRLVDLLINGTFKNDKDGNSAKQALHQFAGG